MQSHAPFTGAIVTWGEAGVGVVATQAGVDPGYGGRALELLGTGVSAPDALKQLIAGDPHPQGRQVAILDAQGRVSVYTGAKAIAAAGHYMGEQYSVQANLMLNDKVWPAMAAGYEAAKGDLADRLLDALDAAEAAGGDIRGRMSAALLIVSAKSTGRPWLGADRVFDVRVDDHPEPLIELRRLVRFQRSANHSNRGDALMGKNKGEEALTEYREAMRLAPDDLELRFWYAATLAGLGRETDAIPIFRELFAKQPFWSEVLQRLPAAGLFPNDAKLLERIMALRTR